jgi:hypothetical protein
MGNQALNGGCRKCTNQPGALTAGGPCRADERGPVGMPHRGVDQGLRRRGRRTGSPNPPGRPRLGVHEHRIARRPLWYVPHLVEGQLDLPNAGACRVAGSQASGLAGSVILVTAHSSMPFSLAMPPVRRVATGRSGSPRRAGVPGPLTSRWPWPRPWQGRSSPQGSLRNSSCLVPLTTAVFCVTCAKTSREEARAS